MKNFEKCEAETPLRRSGDSAFLENFSKLFSLSYLYGKKFSFGFKGISALSELPKRGRRGW